MKNLHFCVTKHFLSFFLTAVLCLLSRPPQASQQWEPDLVSIAIILQRFARILLGEFNLWRPFFQPDDGLRLPWTTPSTSERTDRSGAFLLLFVSFVFFIVASKTAKRWVSARRYKRKKMNTATKSAQQPWRTHRTPQHNVGDIHYEEK